MKRILLKPLSTYRTVLHSDTLFGCLCWAISKVFSEADLVDLLKQFAEGNPPFQISSAFPYRDEEGERSFYYPRPLLAPAELAVAESVADAEMQKQFRKVKWVNEQTLQAFALGQWHEADFFNKNEIWQAEGPQQQTLEVQHNSIDRLSGGTTPNGNLYSLTEHFVTNGGLFFLVDGNTDVVEGALGFLEHLGLGGDSSLGKGRFEISVNDANLSLPTDGVDRFMTLSLYAPRPEEMDLVRADAWYDLSVRKGKVGGPFLRVQDFWKKSLTMFTEGSTFPLGDSRVYGHNPIVKGVEDGLPFDVQQYGFAFQIPMKTKVV